MENSLKLTKSVEDYLKIIYHLQKHKGVIQVKDIACELKVKPPSVVEALKKLSEKGFISHEKYGDIELNEKGSKVAESIIHKHEVLKNFLRILGVDTETASKDACAMEHVLDSKTVDKLKRFSDFTQVCPGNIIDSFNYYKKHGKLPKTKKNPNLSSKKMLNHYEYF